MYTTRGWILYIADDASTKREALKVLERYVANHAEMMYYPRHLAYGYRGRQRANGGFVQDVDAEAEGRGSKWENTPN